MDEIQSYAPGSTQLANNLVEGYQPYSRINELVHNAFIDKFEWNQISQVPLTQFEIDATDAFELLRVRDMLARNMLPQTLGTGYQDSRPDYHEWATVLPGYICVSRKMRDKNWRGFLAAETAAPVIACAAAMPKAMDSQFFFAGIARSKAIEAPDDGRGPSTDSHFTMHIGGVATILNNGRTAIHPGDGVAWTFEFMGNDLAQSYSLKKGRPGPRRIQCLRVAPATAHPRTFGRAINFAKPGEPFDVLIGPVST